MPIAQLNIEGRYPKYTWESKPAANSVSAGTRVTITGWTAPDSDWVSDGTYWRPVNGRAVVHAPVLVNAQAQAATTALVASIPTWSPPASLLMDPLLNIETWVSATFQNASSSQSRNIYVGASDSGDSVIAGAVFGSTNGYRRVWGKIERRSDGTDYVRGVYNSQPYVDGASGNIPISNLLAGPIGVWYRGGATDGSEIATFHNFSIIVGTY